jgi:hypothetical protein
LNKTKSVPEYWIVGGGEKRERENITRIIIIIIAFLTSQLQLGNIHLSCDVVISRIRLGGLICSLRSFLQLNMSQELQIFAFVYMYWDAS